jgi:hypothetical protein
MLLVQMVVCGFGCVWQGAALSELKWLNPALGCVWQGAALSKLEWLNPALAESVSGIYCNTVSGRAIAPEICLLQSLSLQS